MTRKRKFVSLGLAVAIIITALVDCGAPATAPGPNIARQLVVRRPALNDDSLTCISGYSVTNGIVTCDSI